VAGPSTTFPIARDLGWVIGGVSFRDRMSTSNFNQLNEAIKSFVGDYLLFFGSALARLGSWRAADRQLAGSWPAAILAVCHARC
jgi:hypothetical protein